MSPEASQLLKFIAARPKGRVSYALLRRDEIMPYAQDLLTAGLIRERRLGYDEGFQITEAGKARLGGEA